MFSSEVFLKDVLSKLNGSRSFLFAIKQQVRNINYVRNINGRRKDKK